MYPVHGIKGFVIPTKSFVKIGITKIFCYNKMFSSINKTFGCCSKIFGCSNEKFVPNFVAVTKPFFRVYRPMYLYIKKILKNNNKKTKQRSLWVPTIFTSISYSNFHFSVQSWLVIIDRLNGWARNNSKHLSGLAMEHKVLRQDGLGSARRRQIKS